MKYCIVGLLILIAPKLSNAQQFLWQPLQESTTANIRIVNSTSVGLFALDFHPPRPSMLMSTDNGETWKKLPSVGLSGYMVETTNFVFFSTWSKLSFLHKDSLFLTEATEAPVILYSSLSALATKDSLVFVGSQERHLFCSIDEGRTFQSVVLPNFSWATNVIIDNQRVWVSTDRSGIYLSENKGATWINKGFNEPGATYTSLLGVWENRVFVSVGSRKNDDGTLSPGGSYCSLDTGTTWARFYAPDSLEIYCFLFHEQSIFIVTEKGLFRSTDNGATWRNVSLNLPSGAIMSLEIDAASKNLFVSVSRRGIYRANLADLLAVGVREEPPRALSFRSSAAPNPARETVEISFTLPRAARARLALYSALGAEVWRSEAAYYPAGESGVVIDAQGLPPGVYSYRLSAEGLFSVGRVIVAR